MMKRVLRVLAAGIATLLAGALAAALLVRGAPGYGVDERDLDARYAGRHASAAGEPALAFYARYLRMLAHGDLGTSEAYQRPVAELVRERAAATLWTGGAGLAGGWAAAVLLAAAGMFRPRLLGPARAAAMTLLCFPAAALALTLVVVLDAIRAESAAALVIGTCIFARVLLAAAAILAAAHSRGHVLWAQARGLSAHRRVLLHVVRPSAGALAGLAAVHVPVAFGIAVPVESICNVPGLGQLAWLAAQQRDLPVLVNLTMLVLAFTLLSGGLGKAAV